MPEVPPQFNFGWKLKSRYGSAMVMITDFCVKNHTHRFSRDNFPEEIIPLNEWRSCMASLLCARAIDTIGESGKHVLYSAEVLLEARREYECRNDIPLSYASQIKLTEFYGEPAGESDTSPIPEPDVEPLVEKEEAPDEPPTEPVRSVVKESDHFKICPDCGLQMGQSIKHKNAWFCWGCNVTMVKAKDKWMPV